VHPIFFAAEYGHSELVKYLLNAGSEADFENNLGETPMHLAAKNGFLSVIKVLLGRSGSTFPMDNHTKLTLAPIKEAALKGHTQVVKYFLSCVPSPYASASSSLPFAAVSGDIALVSMLLRHGADINFKYIERHKPREALNPHGGRGHESTALSVAVTYGHLALVDFLITNGSDVNLKIGFPTLWTSPLHLALEKGHNEVIKALLAHGADVDDKDLREAILQHNKKALEMLLAKHGTDKCHFNLLELAAEVGDTKILQVLSDKGFDQEQALLKTIEHGQEEIVSLLLAQGTDPDLPSLRESAIGKAIVHRHIGILEVLLRHGAKIYPEDLRSAKVFAPEHIATLAEQFPVHPLSKKNTFPALYNAWEQQGWRSWDDDFGSTRRRLW
jgi:ankyrin repeat protein